MRTADLRYLKIGFSCRPSHRFSQLTVSCPIALELIGYIPGSPSTERSLQRQFSNCWHRGEWYRYEPCLRDFVESLDFEHFNSKSRKHVKSKKFLDPACLGRFGARARALVLSAERRKEIASIAARVRWDAQKLKEKAA